MQWKIIKSNNNYEVSENGDIRNRKNKRILKQWNSKIGYSLVMLFRDGKRKWYSVHRLVATAFIPNPNNLTDVNHINEDKHDNRVENLEWVSHGNNIRHGTRSERQGKTRRENAVCGKKVYCVELNQTFNSMKEAERLTGVRHEGILRCCKGRQKTAGKMHWKYVNES